MLIPPSGKGMQLKIGVISDIHDNIWKLETVLTRLAEVDVLICCGDMCSPFVLKQIAEAFPGPVHVVFGNNDGDKWLLTNIAAKAGNVTLHDTFFQTELEGQAIAVVHFPELALSLAQSNKYQAVFYGHDHKQATRKIGRTWLINPGEVMGRFGRSTYAIFDTDRDEVEVCEA